MQTTRPSQPYACQMEYSLRSCPYKALHAKEKEQARTYADPKYNHSTNEYKVCLKITSASDLGSVLVIKKMGNNCIIQKVVCNENNE